MLTGGTSTPTATDTLPVASVLRLSTTVAPFVSSPVHSHRTDLVDQPSRSGSNRAMAATAPWGTKNPCPAGAAEVRQRVIEPDPIEPGFPAVD